MHEQGCVDELELSESFGVLCVYLLPDLFTVRLVTHEKVKQAQYETYL